MTSEQKVNVQVRNISFLLQEDEEPQCPILFGKKNNTASITEKSY